MWVLFALASALFQASGDMFNKRSTSVLNDYELSLGIYIVSGAVLLPFAICYQGSLSVATSFWFPYACVCILDIAGMVCYLKAIRASDLSLTLPFQMFTPLFLLITSPIMIGEYPSLFGLFGVVLIVIGSYCVNSKSNSQDLFYPFRALITEAGPRYMCFGACIASVSCNLHKICLQAAGPLTHAALHRMGMLLILVLLGKCIYGKRKESRIQSYHILWQCWPAAFCFALAIALHLSAISLGLVVYATAVKRTSVLFGICLATIFFKEKGFRQRFTGASIMTAGVFCMAL